MPPVRLELAISAVRHTLRYTLAGGLSLCARPRNRISQPGVDKVVVELANEDTDCRILHRSRSDTIYKTGFRLDPVQDRSLPTTAECLIELDESN